MRKTKLPAPRLQLRWAPSETAGYQWQCHYELVIPLREYDIRREVWKNGRKLKREATEVVVALKEPSLRNSSATPCRAQDGTRYYDSPYRDGAHSHWDAEVLGSPPIFVIAPDGLAFEYKPRQEPTHDQQ